ncbi:hypothetical protein Bbelb_446510 [Branchiostoma belcheri]|nr:hypothetical protein Bbelb_446510 [Branchiostoma belcheri]
MMCEYEHTTVPETPHHQQCLYLEYWTTSHCGITWETLQAMWFAFFASFRHKKPTNSPYIPSALTSKASGLICISQEGERGINNIETKQTNSLLRKFKSSAEPAKAVHGEEKQQGACPVWGPQRRGKPQIRQEERLKEAAALLSQVIDVVQRIKEEVSSSKDTENLLKQRSPVRTQQMCLLIHVVFQLQGTELSAAGGQFLGVSPIPRGPGGEVVGTSKDGSRNLNPKDSATNKPYFISRGKAGVLGLGWRFTRTQRDTLSMKSQYKHNPPSEINTTTDVPMNKKSGRESRVGRPPPWLECPSLSGERAAVFTQYCYILVPSTPGGKYGMTEGVRLAGLITLSKQITESSERVLAVSGPKRQKLWHTDKSSQGIVQQAVITPTKASRQAALHRHTLSRLVQGKLGEERAHPGACACALSDEVPNVTRSFTATKVLFVKQTGEDVHRNLHVGRAPAEIYRPPVYEADTSHAARRFLLRKSAHTQGY